MNSPAMLALACLLLSLNACTEAQPSLSLEDCPTQYAPQDSSCLCVVANVTMPSSRLLWKDPSKKTVEHGQVSETSLQLPFSRIEAKYNGMTYTCELVDESISPTFITYTPKVAMPPSQPALKDCPLDYIPPTDKYAHCTCMTTDRGVPAALLLWEDPEQTMVKFTNEEKSLGLPFTSVEEHFSGRAYRCVLRHITGDLMVSYTPLLVVKPESPVVEGLKGQYVINELVSLKCTVKGGVPGTQKIFFNCDNHSDRPDEIEGSQLTSSLLFNAMITDNHTQCDCYGTNDYFLSSMLSVILHVGWTDGSDEQPMMSLEDCPKYFVTNEPSCTCVAENIGNSSSAILWKDPEGKTNEYQTGSNSSLRLTLSTVDVTFNKRQYKCDLLHSSGVHTISYTLNIAVSPSSPTLDNCADTNQPSNDPNAVCTCTTTSLGEPAALFVWDDPEHNAVVFTRNETSLALPFAALNETYRGQAYRCILRHITGDFAIEYTPPTHYEDEKKGSLSGGAIAGIVLGTIAFICLILAAMCFIRRRFKK
ncbi:uncharacterized protein [Littorina saxatilis]|uniref:uncharacterized protein n=1 Tax=Littorina saxatilis TaxID=31220 RepID=UPI0038B63AE5